MAPTRSSLQLLPLLSILLTGASSLPSNDRYTDSSLASRDGPAFSPLGCFTDNEGGVRALDNSQTASDDMTVEKCAAFCSKYSLFGIEYGRECFCGNTKAGANHEVAASECSFPCAGNSAQKCGAGDRLNIFTNANPVIIGPATGLEGITSLGCFVDGDPRVLPYNIVGADDMTAAHCAAHCTKYDFDYFGTQYSRECYCGTSSPTHAAPASECSMVCSGNPNELCGASQRLNVYRIDYDDDECEEGPEEPPTSIPTIDGFEYQGCYTDNVPHRVLSGIVAISDPSMTPAKCAAACTAKGFPWFGTEYGVECYCGHELNPASTKVAGSECSMLCGGDPSSHCGNLDRLSIYAAQGVPVQVPAGNLPTVGAFRYSSCWADELGHRVLEAVDYRTDDMTIEKCAAKCEDYSFFGLQYGRECYCGNEVRGGHLVAESDCGMLCVGKKDQLCGGPSRLNLYTREAASSSSSIHPSSSAPSSSIFSSSPSSSSAPASSSVVSSASSSAPSSAVTSSSSSSSAPASSSVVSSVASSAPMPSSEAASSSSSTPASTSVVSSAASSAPVPSSAAASSAMSSSAAAASSASISAPASSAPVPSSAVTSSAISSSAAPASSPSMSTPAPSSSAVLSTTTPPSSSTTQPPASTTITTCPSSSTVDGPEQCYLAGHHPAYCNTLTATNVNSARVPSMLSQCRRSITSYGNPAATSCFPTSIPPSYPNNAVAIETGSSILSCILSASCTFASDCKTSTYPLTAPIPSPTPSIGVNLVKNPSFELTDLPAGSSWTFSSLTSPNFPQEISTSRGRTGPHAYKARYMNINGVTIRFNQLITGLEPLRTYQVRAWYLHTNPNTIGVIMLMANPGGFTTAQQSIAGKPVNTWHELVLEFTVVSSFVQVNIEHNSQVVGNTGTSGGLAELYVDDVSLIRVN